MLSGCKSVLQRPHKESSRLQNDDILPFPSGEVLQKASNPLYTCIIYNNSKSKWQIWQTLNNGLKLNIYGTYRFFVCLKYFWNLSLCPSICSLVFASFPVQTTL